jgi:hypothetical protein
MNYNGNSNNKIMLMLMLQTALAAEAHLAEGQFLLAEDTLNMGKSLIR